MTEQEPRLPPRVGIRLNRRYPGLSSKYLNVIEPGLAENAQTGIANGEQSLLRGDLHGSAERRRSYELPIQTFDKHDPVRNDAHRQHGWIGRWGGRRQHKGDGRKQLMDRDRRPIRHGQLDGDRLRYPNPASGEALRHIECSVGLTAGRRVVEGRFAARTDHTVRTFRVGTVR